MTKDEFLDWKTDPRTKEIFVSIERECYENAKLLAQVAGLNPLQDRFQVGYIKGMEAMLDIKYEETSEDA